MSNAPMQQSPAAGPKNPPHVKVAERGTVLFDPRGPRARVRDRLVTAVFCVVLLVVAVWVILTLKDNGQLAWEKWKPFTERLTWTTYLLPGLWGTLRAAAISIVFALVLGTFLGLGRLSDHRWVRWACGAVVELFRSIPVLIMMLFAYFIFAQYSVFPSTYLGLAAVVFGLTLYNGSVIAEILRSGINSLPKGQLEASYALGLRKPTAMRMILLPQAVSAMLPALVSQMVVALKDSALGYLIGYVEVVRSGIQSASYYRNYFAALVVVAVIMIVINYALTRLARWLERTLRERRAR